MFFVIFWTALVRYTWLSNSSRFFFPTINTFGCFWSQWPTSLAVTSGCPTMRCGRLPSRSDVNKTQEDRRGQSSISRPQLTTPCQNDTEEMTFPPFMAGTWPVESTKPPSGMENLFACKRGVPGWSPVRLLNSAETNSSDGWYKGNSS